MANVHVLYAENVAGPTAATTTQVDACEIAAGDFQAGHTYLIIANSVLEENSSSNEARTRLVHGETPTVFDDAALAVEPTSGTQDTEQSWMYLFTQPATAERVRIQISNSSTSTTTCRLAQILAIDLTTFTVDTHYKWNELLTDSTLTTSMVNKAITSSFTPNGSDVWLFIGNIIWSPVTTITTQVQYQLNDSVAGVLFLSSREGEDVTNDFLGANLFWVGVPTNSARTLALQANQLTTADANHMASRVAALNLTAMFSQVARTFAAAEVDPATTPTYTTVATLSPTPNETGQWVVLAFSNQDVNETTTDWEARLQINPDGGGLVSRPNASTVIPSIDQWDATDQNGFNMFNLVTLVSGASRAINWDWRQVAGTTGRVQDNGLVAFSVKRSGADTSFPFPRTRDRRALIADNPL